MRKLGLVLLSIVVGCSGARAGDPPPGGPDASASDSNAEPPIDASMARPLINEFMRKPPNDPLAGVETTEFIEIIGSPETDYSAFAILQVRGNGVPAEKGLVRSEYPIGTTDGDGFWATGFLTDELKNNTYTLLLVENYDSSGSDLDIDADDDGVIDNELWDALVDSVAYVDDGPDGPTDLTYGPAVLTPGLDGNTDEYEGASRLPDGTDTDSATDWVRNDPDGAGLPGFDGTPESGEALSTMGAPNEEVTATN